MRQVPDLLREPAGPATQRLSVIVPARDEGRAVASGLRSLRDSQGVDLEVIAVDDRSTDTTGATMDSLALEPLSPRTQYVVEPDNSLPEGWLGKPHAMALGAARASGDWLLFSDADVIYAPDALVRSMHYVERTGADHLVLIPNTLLESPGETMMLRFLGAIAIWGPRLWRVSDPTAARDAVGWEPST